MNIFILSTNLTKNAQFHTNKHLVKMILEQTQLLCNAYYYTPILPSKIYKLYNKNHPASIWARQNLQNWLWLKQNTLELLKEYEYRYQKQHKCATLLLTLPNPQLPNFKRTPFVQVVPPQYKAKNAVLAYRNYYLNEKQHTFSWKNRQVPPFVKKHLNASSSLINKFD